MSKAFPALAALVLLGACSSSETSTPALQRYDRMRRELDWITVASHRVALDAGRLELAMSHARPSRVRAAAVRLKLDAHQYSRRAGAAGNAVRALASAESSRQVRAYFSTVTQVLTWQWVEGVALAFVADQAWADPLSVRGNDAQRLAADVAWAQKAARQAIRASAAARAIRQRAGSQFRYTIATPSG